MAKTVDARGLACPKPVLAARAALADGGVVVVLVDNEIARDNVSRMAESRGCEVATHEEQPGQFRLTLTPGTLPAGSVAAALSETSSPAAGTAPLVVVLSSDEMGRGEPELGRLLMRTFLQTLAEVEPLPDAIVCYNTGARLALEEAPTVPALQSLASAGVRVLVCGTCLDYFSAKEKLAVGEVSNMFTLAELLTSARSVIQP